MKRNCKSVIAILSAAMLFAACACDGGNGGSSMGGEESNNELVISYSFDETSGNTTKNNVNDDIAKIDYVFNEENKYSIFKDTSDPLRKDGVSGNALYMDGFSTYIRNASFQSPRTAMTLSAWVAPRVFENLAYYPDESIARGNPRLTGVINKGDIEMGEGFLMGYGRLGLWGVQLALYNNETGEDFIASFYDPLNALPLYQWSNIAVSYDGETGYIGLFYNGEKAYEALIPELVNTQIISSEEALYIGKYVKPMVEFGVPRQLISGLLDEVRIYKNALSPKDVKKDYTQYTKNGAHPDLLFDQIALDSSVYAGDRYRPQYHAIPPAVWMNEPHSPFYYKGKYHVFYQHNPSGPYWSQIRWGHLVSDDMIHWVPVKDAVVPTAGICPEGVWTGGACIGPDGTPWLAITAGTNTTTWSGQNVAFAHAADPNDPYLTDWIVEDKLAITHPSDDSQGLRDQFRDPFVWYDDGTYYMMVSTSVPNAGGSANVYTSSDMREWEYRGYLFQCDYNLYPEQGINWECVVMLPITTKDGSKTKYILFDCPQYPHGSEYIVECYYWIGTFDKASCRFIADHAEPRLFDRGRGVYTGQNGYCFLTEEDIAAGKTVYEQGRTVIYSIAQGKDAGTAQNIYAGWAHNFAIPLELWLADNGVDVIREPIREIQSLYGDTLYEYSGTGKSVTAINEEIKNLRGDMFRIDMEFSVAPSAAAYGCGLYVRYNPTENMHGTERTKLMFDQTGVYVDRTKSSLHEYVSKQPSHTWGHVANSYKVTVLMDRSMLEVYVNGIMSFTTRIYPKYGDSDYLRLFEDNAKMNVTSLTIRKMKGAYTDNVVEAFYGNIGNLADL